MPSGAPREPFKRISATEAKEMIDKGGIQLIDVRQPAEYTGAHIAGSELIPVDAIFARMEEVSQEKPVIFHCAVGVRSALACEMAAAMGRTKIFNMEGGMDAWKAHNYPSEKGPYTPPAKGTKKGK